MAEATLEVTKTPLNKSRTQISLVSGGEQIGSAVIGSDKKTPDGVYVQEVNIREEKRGKGYGRALMHAVREAVSDKVIKLEVPATNTAAINLYKGTGYEVVEEITDKQGNKYLKMVNRITV